MPVKTSTFKVKTMGMTDLHDITKKVAKCIAESDLANGIATVFTPGSTAGVTTMEFEPGLQQDVPAFLEKLAPYRNTYRHQETWHDDNGSSHIRAMLIGPSLTVPFVKGEMTLGTWQQIVLLCFDTRPRDRELVVQMIGE